MRIFILVGVLVAMAISGPQVRATPPSDACALLTPEQVGEAVGAKMGPGKYVSPEFTKTCTWTAPGLIVTLMLQTEAQYQAGKKAPAPSEVTSVPGLGDEAYYLTVGNLVGLGVKIGTTALKVTVYKSSLSTEMRQQMEKTLAQQVLTKL